MPTPAGVVGAVWCPYSPPVTSSPQGKQTIKTVSHGEWGWGAGRPPVCKVPGSQSGGRSHGPPATSAARFPARVFDSSEEPLQLSRVSTWPCHWGRSPTLMAPKFTCCPKTVCRQIDAPDTGDGHSPASRPGPLGRGTCVVRQLDIS